MLIHHPTAPLGVPNFSKRGVRASVPERLGITPTEKNTKEVVFPILGSLLKFEALMFSGALASQAIKGSIGNPGLALAGGAIYTLTMLSKAFSAKGKREDVCQIICQELQNYKQSLQEYADLQGISSFSTDDIPETFPEKPILKTLSSVSPYVDSASFGGGVASLAYGEPITALSISASTALLDETVQKIGKHDATRYLEDLKGAIQKVKEECEQLKKQIKANETLPIRQTTKPLAEAAVNYFISQPVDSVSVTLDSLISDTLDHLNQYNPAFKALCLEEFNKIAEDYITYSQGSATTHDLTEKVHQFTKTMIDKNKNQTPPLTEVVIDNEYLGSGTSSIRSNSNFKSIAEETGEALGLGFLVNGGTRHMLTTPALQGAATFAVWNLVGGELCTSYNDFIEARILKKANAKIVDDIRFSQRVQPPSTQNGDSNNTLLKSHNPNKIFPIGLSALIAASGAGASFTNPIIGGCVGFLAAKATGLTIKHYCDDIRTRNKELKETLSNSSGMDMV